MQAFSARGPSEWEPNVLKPDVTAPGVDILAGHTPDVANNVRGESFQYLSGTSMAVPARGRRRGPAEGGSPGLESGGAQVGPGHYGAAGHPQGRRRAPRPIPSISAAGTSCRTWPLPRAWSTTRAAATTTPFFAGAARQRTAVDCAALEAAGFADRRQQPEPALDRHRRTGQRAGRPAPRDQRGRRRPSSPRASRHQARLMWK